MRDGRRLTRAGLLLGLAIALIVAPITAAAPPPRLEALIVDGQSNHGWRETTAALKATLLNTGRFTVDVSSSPPEGAPPAAWAAWQPQFADYDVVLTDYKGQMWPAAVRLGLEQYVSAGGGLFIIHASLATFFTPHLLAGEQDWTGYSDMMNLGWRPFFLGSRITVDDATGNLDVFPPFSGPGSDHGAQHSFVVKSRRPGHPIMDGLPLEWLHGKDELYHAMRGPAQNIDVLASAFSALSTGGTGAHEPMLWTTPYGLGRVVTSVMGHRWAGTGYGPPGTVTENGPDALHCAGLQTLIARSAEWAAGEDVTVPVPAAFPTAGATSLVDPVRGLWLRLGLKVNGQHPAGDVVVTPGPLRLTLDSAAGLWTETLDLYFALVVGTQVLWITSTGVSATPAPVASLTPVALEDLELLNTTLAPGTVLTFLMFFAEGSTVTSYDYVSAVAQP
jgi:hypothetical protein